MGWHQAQMDTPKGAHHLFLSLSLSRGDKISREMPCQEQDLLDVTVARISANRSWRGRNAQQDLGTRPVPAPTQPVVRRQYPYPPPPKQSPGRGSSTPPREGVVMVLKWGWGF